MKKQLTDDFLWGASISAHQVEGGTHNQWSEWEKANADALAATAEARLSWLPEYDRIRQQAEDPANYISGDGVEHYQRYREDFELLKSLNMNALRFGIEWSRLEPEEGEWDEHAVRHYHAYIDALNEMGIKPVLTLWHWTLPVWFADKGGFEQGRNLRYFERYVERVAREYGGKVRYVLTLNEPNVYTSLSYGAGEWPPERKSPLRAFAVYYHLTLAHKKAYKVLKDARPELMVGTGPHFAYSRPLNPRNPINRAVVDFISYAWNWWFLDRIRGQLDFIGVNFYHSNNFDWRGREKNPPEPVSDLGWYMQPSDICLLLTRMHRRYGKPLLITENGLADAEDKQRQWWLTETMAALEKARADGVDLIGYLHWSLVDNFEWKFGWWPRFGLVAVDRGTMKRRVRGSAKWLAEYIRTKT